MAANIDSSNIQPTLNEIHMPRKRAGQTYCGVLMNRRYSDKTSELPLLEGAMMERRNLPRGSGSQCTICLSDLVSILVMDEKTDGKSLSIVA